MDFNKLGLSRRSVAIAAALVGMVSLAIGAHAALNKRALDAARATAAEQGVDAARRAACAGGRLPEPAWAGKGLFAAVPQNERNWTPNPPAPPQT